MLEFLPFQILEKNYSVSQGKISHAIIAKYSCYNLIILELSFSGEHSASY